MTIKDFSALCGCNPQTLRYYDHENLLKPARVDRWSGYRFYEEDQALVFVKIKNLQKAGFTIEEIKELLDRDDSFIYQAFERKIAEGQARLREIKEIQKSYQTEMTGMEEKLKTWRAYIQQSMEDYDPAEEFGISKEDYQGLIDSVNEFFERHLRQKDYGDLDFREYRESDDAEEEPDLPDFKSSPEYELVFEKHGWRYVREFYPEFSRLKDGREYALLFELLPEKCGNSAFANTILGMLLQSNPGRKTSLGCNITHTNDGQNHFWLFRKT